MVKKRFGNHYHNQNKLNEKLLLFLPESSSSSSSSSNTNDHNKQQKTTTTNNDNNNRSYHHLHGNNLRQFDHSIIRESINLGIRSVHQILTCINDGTKEIKDLLLNECEIIYECRKCRNLFRSLANFLAHKRLYCRKHYCEQMLLFDNHWYDSSDMNQRIDPDEIVSDKAARPPDDSLMDSTDRKESTKPSTNGDNVSIDPAKGSTNDPADGQTKAPANGSKVDSSISDNDDASKHPTNDIVMIMDQNNLYQSENLAKSNELNCDYRINDGEPSIHGIESSNQVIRPPDDDPKSIKKKRIECLVEKLRHPSCLPPLIRPADAESSISNSSNGIEDHSMNNTGDTNDDNLMMTRMTDDDNNNNDNGDTGGIEQASQQPQGPTFKRYETRCTKRKKCFYNCNTKSCYFNQHQPAAPAVSTSTSSADPNSNVSSDQPPVKSTDRTSETQSSIELSIVVDDSKSAVSSDSNSTNKFGRIVSSLSSADTPSPSINNVGGIVKKKKKKLKKLRTSFDKTSSSKCLTVILPSTGGSSVTTNPSESIISIGSSGDNDHNMDTSLNHNPLDETASIECDNDAVVVIDSGGSSSNGAASASSTSSSSQSPLITKLSLRKFDLSDPNNSSSSSSSPMSSMDHKHSSSASSSKLKLHLRSTTGSKKCYQIVDI